MVNIHGYFMVNDGFRDNLLGGWPTQPLWKKKYGDSVIHSDLANNKLDIYGKYMEIPSGKLTVCYWKLPFSSLIYP